MLNKFKFMYFLEYENRMEDGVVSNARTWKVKNVEFLYRQKI